MVVTKQKRIPDARLRIERNMTHFWERNYSRTLSASSQALFLKILHHAHMNDWKADEVILNTRLVGAELKLGKQALLSCIDELVKLEIITYTPGLGRGNGSTFRLLACERT